MAAISSGEVSSLPAQKATGSAVERLGGLDIGRDEVPLGGVARRGEGQHIALVVDDHRSEVVIDTGEDTLVALGSATAQIGQDRGYSVGHPARREADAHVVADAGLAGRVYLLRGVFGHKDAGLDPGAAAYARQLAGVEELVHAIQHVKIDDAHQCKAALLAEPGERGGRVAVGVEGEEAVAVHVHGASLGVGRDGFLPSTRGQGAQGSRARGGVERIQF